MRAGADLGRWAALVAGLLFVTLVYLAGFFETRARDLRASDDNIWLYMTAAELREPARAEGVRRIILEEIPRHAASPEIVTRFEQRAGYRENYFAFSWLMSAVSVAHSSPGQAALPGYADAISTVTLTTTTLSAVIALLLLIAGLGATGRATYPLAAGITLIVIGALSGVVEPGSFVLFERTDPAVAIDNLWKFTVNPGDQFTLFGFTPRSYLFLLTLVVFAFRWRGWWAASYWAAVPLIFVHQSLAALFIALLVGVDCVLRRSMLIRPAVATAIAAAGLVWAARETLWNYVSPTAAAAAPFAVAAALALYGWSVYALGRAVRSGRTPFLLKSPAFLAPLTRLHPALGDLVVIGAVWVFTLPVSYAITLTLDPVIAKYFWAQIGGRLYSLIYPGLIFAALVVALERLRVVDRRPYIVAVAVGLAALAPAWSLASTRYDYTAFRAAMRDVADLIDRPIGEAINFRQEAAVYMAAARELDTGEPRTALMFAPPGAVLQPAAPTPR
ncbi:MAG: hypothetical protein NW200_14245 [Hyphomonadaceae bacterium]|nr:hypothetical protein [Hyphomonadaceae bacterium]